MALTKEKKGQILEKLKGITGSKSVVFVNFHGLSVDDANEMRSDFHGKEVGYMVAKKTLAKKAFSESGIEGEIPELPGELAIAWGDDPVVPAGSIWAFQKKYEDAVSIVGGVYENRFMTKEEMSELAQIPPKEVLLGMFVNLINSPLQRLAIVMGQIVEKKEA